MKILLVLTAIAMVQFMSTNANSEFRVVHYNIKELTTDKLNEGQTNEQVKYATEILQKLAGDFVSINEMQFDMPGSPTKNYVTNGQNVFSLAKLLGWENLSYDAVFTPANTGTKALRDKDGNFSTTFDRSRADQTNFGLFPGQYSTAGLFKKSKFKIINQQVISGLLWKDFKTDVDLTPFKDALGNPHNRDTMELFDKSFTDMTMEFKGETIRFILLHTVPAFGFGNEKSVNYVRNKDQIAFLEWYLTGQTYFKVNAELLAKQGIRPLPKGTKFIAMGDWNVATSSNNPGAPVLKGLLDRFKPAVPETITYIGSHFHPQPPKFSKQLDYILLSPGLEISDSGVYSHKREFIDKGCGIEPADVPAGYTQVLYKLDRNGPQCYGFVPTDFYKLKTASDHLPVWVDVRVAD